MAKPNYSFEKRQREIAKKKKKEEKLARKQSDAPNNDEHDATAGTEPGTAAPEQG